MQTQAWGARLPCGGGERSKQREPSPQQRPPRALPAYSLSVTLVGKDLVYCPLFESVATCTAVLRAVGRGPSPTLAQAPHAESLGGGIHNQRPWLGVETMPPPICPPHALYRAPRTAVLLWSLDSPPSTPPAPPPQAESCLELLPREPQTTLPTDPAAVPPTPEETQEGV